MSISKEQVEQFQELLVSSYRHTSEQLMPTDDFLNDPYFSQRVMADITESKVDAFEWLLVSALRRSLLASAPCALVVFAAFLTLDIAPRFAEARIVWASFAPL